MSKIDEFKKKYKIQSVEEEEEQKASSSPIEEFKKKYNITTTDETDKLGSYERSKRESKTSQVISSNFDRMGSSTGIDGYKKYLEDEEAKKTAPKYDLNNDGQDAWWEKALGYLGGGGGGVVDTTLPTAGVTQAVHDLRADESYKRPSKDWSVKQKSEFGELYLTSPESAFAYAEKTNKQNNKRKEESEIDKIQREATKNFGYGVGHTVGAIATAPLGLADYLGDLAYSAAGRDIAPDGSVSPFEYSQAVTGGISEHLNEEVGTLPEDWWMVGGKGLGDLYGLGTSIAQSMASAYTLGGVGTLVSYFGQAAAAGVDDAIARGASDDQALIYGAALGTFEGVAEMVGIDNLFKLGSASTIKGLIKNILKQAGAEGGEEFFTAVTSEIADRWIMADKSNFNLLVEELMAQGMSEADAKKKAWMSTLGDIAFDTIAGAVSGSVSGGIHSGVQTAITNADAKANYSGQAQDMVSEALASEDANTRTVGEKYQKKLNDNKRLSGWNINHLLETTDTQKVKSAVEAQLTKLGESGDVSTLAEVITKQTQGIELSKKEQAIIDGSKFGQRVVNTLKRENIKSGEYDTRWAKDIGTRRLNADVYNKSLSDHISDAVDAERKARLELREMDSVTENATSEENAVESEISAPVEGVKSVAKAKMTDAEGNETPVKVAKIVDVENGEASLELEGGETVKASDVDFGDSGIGFVYQAATEMVSGVGGFNVDAANLMVKAVNPNISEAAASLYVAGFNEAYRYGAMGYPVSALAANPKTSQLTEEQRKNAYNFGRAFGNEKVAQKQSANVSLKQTLEEKQRDLKRAEEHMEFMRGGVGDFDFEIMVTGKEIKTLKAEISDIEKKIVNTVSNNAENISKTDSKEKKGKVYFDGSAVGKNLTERQRASLKGLRVVAEAMGIDIHIFESTIGENGKRQGANGWYDPATKEIHLDLYAGVDGNGLMLFTASHELTHHIKEVAPAKFKVFADALLDEFTKNGKSIDELISRKLETLEANGRLEGLTQEQAYDLAYEEVVADAAESMLVDSNAIEALSRKLQAKDKSLWETIKDFIAKLVNRIKAAYEGLDPDSHEGKLVREMKDSAERLRQLWVDALLEASDMVEIDTNTESVAPMLSERTWTESEYVTHRDQMAEKIAKALDVSLQKAKSYIDDINSIAKMIAEDRVRLDYEASSFGSAFVSNVEYGGSFDYTTLCKKRRIYTGTFTEIQKRLKDVALTPDDILKIRNLMIEEGIEATCGLCYVEGSRANMGKFAKKFIELYKRDNPDAWIPNMADVNTPDGVEKMRINHPEAYERYEYFWNHYGKLKESDPALFASQQKPKLYEARKEYKGEILEHFKGDSTVAKKNLNGGIRMQSFSDFEIVHLIDTMQVIMDMSTIGLAGQAYTKVPEFAKAFGNTGLKINLSLIAKGVDADGNLIFDDREGMPHDTAFELRTKYSKNVGTIIVTFTDEQLLAAMADPRIDFIIPFHRSQWKKGQYGAMGLPKGTKDYTFMQNEKLIKQTYHEYQGRMVKDKASNYMPNEYWDFSKSGKENAEAYLKMCAENNKRPKFYKLLAYDGNGTYSLKADGSTDGYWKLLIDFKMYDNEGIGSPQMAVTPTFNMDEARTMLDEYKGGHSEYPVASGVVDKFVNEYKTKYSDRDSEGNELSKEQQKFFKDSKVRDKKGNLMVLYHGTTANFNTFKKGDVGFHFGTKGAARGRVGFGKNVTLKEVYLNITNPIVFDEDLGSWDADYRLTEELYDRGILTQAEAESVLLSDDKSYRRTTEAANKKLASLLVEKGYDGIAYSNTFETKKATTSYIVFNSNQAKEITNKTPTASADIRYSDRIATDEKQFNPEGKTLDEQLEDILHTSESFDGRYLYIGRFTSDFVDMVKPYVEMKDLPVAMNYRDAYLSMESAENGKYKGNGINYHNLGKEGLKSAIESFGSPEQVLLSKKDGKVELVLQGVDKKGNKLLSIVALNTNARNAEKYIEAHIVTSIYGKRSIDRYVSKAEQEGRLIYNKKEELTQVNSQVQYEGIINANSSVNSIAQDTENVNRKFSDRDPDSYSNRSLLAGALETAAQNDIERDKLAQYKEKIDLLNAEEQKLLELRTKIKELSFAKGTRDTEAIKSLQLEANQAANRINTYDRQLLNLESTKALKGVLEREKALARKRDAQKYKEALERYREKSAKTQRELMERYQESRKRGVESRNKTAMRYKIKEVVNDLNNYLLKGTKDKHVPIELQRAVAEALDAVNMDTVGADERIAKKQAKMRVAKSLEEMQRLSKEIEHIQEMGGNMEAKISRLKTAYDSIINSDDPLVANSHDDVISSTIGNVMEYVGETPLRDMSLPQLEAVYDMYRMVLHSIRNANKAFKAKKSEEISVIANRVLEEIDKLGKKKALQTKAGQTASEFDWNNQKPVYAFERIGSNSFTEVFNNVRAGEDTWAVDMTEAQKFLEDQKQNHKFDSWDFDKKYEFTSSTGKNFKLSLGQIMSLYAYSKRGDQAKDHLRNGGFVFDGLTEVKEKNKLGVTKTYQLKDATAYNLSDETLSDILSKLTPEQKAFADAMQDYLSTVMGEKGNEVSLELYGVKLFKEKNYFPLKSAPQYLERAREQAQGDTKIKNKGFTKETTPKAKNPIVLTSFMDVWAGHVNEMSMYHAFTLPLEDFYRVYNYKTPASETMDSESVISFLENAHGDASVSYIDQLLKDLNGGARSDPRESAAKALMSKFKKASVMASLSVVVQQPSAIIRAQALVDAKYFVGKKVSSTKHKETWAEVKKYAPVAVIKEMGYFDVGMGQSSVEWLKGEKTLMDKVDDALSKAPAFADELAWVSIWNAVKRETAHNNPTLKTSSEEFLKLAGERFTEVIVKTQVYDSTLARSANMRSKSAFMSMWTAFMAEPTTSINMLQDAFKKGNKKQIARTIGAVYGSVVLNAALVSLVYAMRDDDEDETFLEKYLSRLTTEVIDGINPLTYVPFVKDIWSALQGFDIERSDMTLITKVIDSLQQLVKVAAKDTSDMDDAELKEHRKAVSEAILSITDNLASLTGVPVMNIRRDINGIINGFKTIKADIEGRETTAGSLGDNILDDVKDSVPVWGWLPDEKKGDKLYDAIIKGDKAYEERLKSGYKNDTAINSAIRKALRENDPRIKMAAECLNAGDLRRRDVILDTIVAEGHFDEKLVGDAIRAEANAIKEESEGDSADSSDDDKDEVYSIYQANDINVAFESGDTALAKEIIQDLIDTKVANGMDEKKAKSSLRSSMTSYWKPLYKMASQAEKTRIRKILYNSGLYGTVNDVVKTAQDWLKD